MTQVTQTGGKGRMYQPEILGGLWSSIISAYQK